MSFAEKQAWFQAAREGNAQTLKQMCGKMLGTLDHNNATALMKVCSYNGDPELVALLQGEAGLVDSRNRSALLFAVVFGNVTPALVRLLACETNIKSSNWSQMACSFQSTREYVIVSALAYTRGPSVLEAIVAEDLLHPETLRYKYTDSVLDTLRAACPSAASLVEGFPAACAGSAA